MTVSPLGSIQLFKPIQGGKKYKFKDNPNIQKRMLVGKRDIYHLRHKRFKHFVFVFLFNNETNYQYLWRHNT